MSPTQSATGSLFTLSTQFRSSTLIHNHYKQRLLTLMVTHGIGHDVALRHLSTLIAKRGLRAEPGISLGNCAYTSDPFPRIRRLYLPRTRFSGTLPSGLFTMIVLMFITYC